MPPRPRRSAPSTSATTPVDPDVDQDFLALSAQQRKSIDRAFDRGLNNLRRKGNSSKRRKINTGDAISAVDDGEGGFVFDGDDGGGFIPDNDGEGGFFPDGDGDGGFIPDDDDGGFIPTSETPGTDKTDDQSDKIPLHLLPALLTSLGLPSDEDVLSVFQASAKGWEGDSGPRRRRIDDEEEERLGVERKDFRAVCAALMGPDNGEDGDIPMNSEEEGEEDDVFNLSEGDSGSDSPLSSLSSASSYDGGGLSRSKNKSKSKVISKDFATPPKGSSRKSRKVLEASTGSIKLSARQKEVVKDIWDMLKSADAATMVTGTSYGRGKARSADVLGRDEVRNLVRTLGEMWSEDEITEMVTLFSTQHEQRGLSFDDFGAVMLRAGLV